MRIVPVLFPCDLGRSDRGLYVQGGERGAPDVLLDALEGEGVRLGRPVAVPVEVPTDPDPADAPLKFDAALARATLALAEVVEKVNGEADFPLILGGDQIALMGHALGHSRRHAAGIGLAVLADAYLDLELPGAPAYEDAARLRKDPEVTSTGDGQRMALAGALGLIPTTFELGRALAPVAVQRKQASVVGVRGSRSAQVRAQERKVGVEVWDMERLELDGEAAYRSLLTRHLSAGPILLSLDVTGLDPDMMTAVRDSRPDGLDWSFLKRSLEQCLPHVPRLLGFDICGLDHTQDDAHQGGLSRFVDTIAPFLRRLVR